MAQKTISTAEAERMNLVAQDEIWRYRLKAETKARKNWAQKWGFLTTPFEEGSYNKIPQVVTLTSRNVFRHNLGDWKSEFQLIEHQGEEPSIPKPKLELPERFHIRPVTPVEKYIKVLPSPPIPETTQGFIGWRSGQPDLNKYLEHDREIRSCKGAYAMELGWPKQGIH